MDKSSWFGNRSEAELRKVRAETFYEFEMKCRRQNWGDPVFVYDEEHDLFRFHDGKFAFSRQHAN